MDPPREDPLMLLHGSWVEVAPFGSPDQEDDDEEDPRLEAILLEAQMDPAPAPSASEQHRRGGGGPPAPKGSPSEEDRSPAGKREEPERPPHCASLDWPWPSPPEPRLPPKELACVGPPACAPRLGRKRGLRDPQVLLLVGPSLLLSHVLALGLGICLGKRLAASSSSAI